MYAGISLFSLLSSSRRHKSKQNENNLIRKHTILLCMSHIHKKYDDKLQKNA